MNIISHKYLKNDNGWYVFFYTFNPKIIERNFGFMWEPGAFAFMIVLAQIIRFNYNNFTLDNKSFIYIIAIISTFSTAGYIALFFIIISYIIYNKKNILYVIILMPIFIYTTYELTFSLDILSEKIISYITNKDVYYFEGELYGGSWKLNRIGYFLYSLKEGLKIPFGHGIYLDAKFVGVGSFSTILLSWGWIGCVVMTYCIWKVVKIHGSSQNNLPNIFLTFSLIIMFFSNPFGFSEITFIFFFYPFLYKNNCQFSK